MMPHWLARVPYLPAWTGWATMQNLAMGEARW